MFNHEFLVGKRGVLRKGRSATFKTDIVEVDERKITKGNTFKVREWVSPNLPPQSEFNLLDISSHDLKEKIGTLGSATQ